MEVAFANNDMKPASAYLPNTGNAAYFEVYLARPSGLLLQPAWRQQPSLTNKRSILKRTWSPDEMGNCFKLGCARNWSRTPHSNVQSWHLITNNAAGCLRLRRRPMSH